MKRIKKVLLCTAILVLTCILAGCSKGSDSPDEDIKKDNVNRDTEDIVFGFIDSYNSKGRCYVENCIAHFYDAETGNDVVLCSKPNCKHKRTDAKNVSTCDAYLGARSYAPFIAEDHLYFLAYDDGDIFFDVYLYKADKDGRNRKEIVRLNDVQNINETDYQDGKLALCYLADTDRETVYREEDQEGVSYAKREKRKSGIYLIDVKSGESLLVDDYEEYSANVCNCMLDAGKLYYCVYYNTEDVKYSDFEDIDVYYKKRADVAVMYIYEYDIETGEKKKLFDGSLIFSQRLGEGYITAEDMNCKEYIYLFKNGEKKAYYTMRELNPEGYEPEYHAKHIYDDKMYMMDGKKVWYKDINTGKVEFVADGKLNDKGIIKITAVVGDWVYYQTETISGTVITYGYYVVDKNEFFNGNLENARLMYTSEAYRREPDKSGDSAEDNSEIKDDSDQDENKNGNEKDDNDIEHTGKKDGEGENTADRKKKIEAIYSEYPPRYSGPDDEDTLTWALWQTKIDAELTCERINRKLNGDGYDFKMSIAELAYASPYVAEYGDMMLESDADILFTGINNGADESAWTPGYKGIMEDKFLKLDDYLKNSKLYDYYPEKLWDSVRVNGSIYCIPNPNTMSRCFAIVFKKSAYTKEQIESFDNTMDGIVKLITDEDKLYYTSTGFMSMYGIWQSFSQGIYFEDEEVKSLLDNELYIKGLKALNDLAKKGQLVGKGKSIFDCLDEWSIAFSFDYLADQLDKDEYYVITYPEAVVEHFSASIAINADCKNPDAAFKLIELIMLDQEYANTVLFEDGVILKDGYAYDPETESYTGSLWDRYQWGIKEIAYKLKNESEGYFDSADARKEYYENNLGPVINSALEYPTEVRILWKLEDDNWDIVYDVKNFDKKLDAWIKKASEVKFD